MRKPCKTDTIAPHFHVLTRDIPFIPQGTLSTSPWSHLVLNITLRLIQPEKLGVSTNRCGINRQHLLIGKAQQVMRTTSLGAGA